MPEREPVRRVVREEETAQRAAGNAHRDLVSGLQLLAQVPGMARNFGWAAAEIMGSPNANRRIWGMIEFGIRFSESAQATTERAIATAQGVPVDVHVPHVRYDASTDSVRPAGGGPHEQAVPGRIVGVVGANAFSPSHEFYGVVVVRDERGREDFAAVSITTDGTTTLLPEHFRPEFQGRPGRDVTREILAQKLAQNYMRDGRPRSAS